MADDTENFSKLAFPIVRRIFPNLATAQQMVSVQPMVPLKNNILYTLDYKDLSQWVCKFVLGGTVQITEEMTKQEAYVIMIGHLKNRICAWIEPYDN